MCGFVTMFSTDAPVSVEALRRSVRTLHHRGPDGRREWVAKNGQVGMAHARLSIIDLTTGDQPIANEDEALHIVVNGEFYDFERQRAELQARGHRFRTQSDSEILLHLYEERGTHCLAQLRGEFAFCLWDERNRALFAARDRFGIKPLFYARVHGTLYLASEIKALFEAGVPAQWDDESVHQELHLVSDADRTMFRGVYQVPPGHFLLATRYNTQIVPYWDLKYPSADPSADHSAGHSAPRREDAHYVTQLRQSLVEAVRLRLRADVPVGVYLSGGLDSCALLGVAASLRSEPVDAFTIAFEKGPYDEGPIAEEMAARAGARFHRFDVSEDLLADRFADAVWHCETIIANGNAVAKFILSEKVRDYGFKVVLTGEGSDELFAGYPSFRQDMLLHNTPGEDAATKAERLAALHAANRHYGSFGAPPTVGVEATASIERVLGYVPAWLLSFTTSSTTVRGLLAANFVSELAGRNPYAMLLNRLDARDLATREPVNQSMWLWLKTAFPNRLLNYLGDRMEMAHSIEGRPPLLDHLFAEQAAMLPADLKVRGNVEKYVLREAARPYLTDTVYRRQKHPFLAPPELKGRMRQRVQDVLRTPKARTLHFFDWKKVDAFLDAGPADASPTARGRYFATCIQLTSLCVLQERYGL
ncbi:MAG TPA: asparagine synthase (glutamine-hydrolyzing) [Polyangiales bacterium]